MNRDHVASLVPGLRVKYISPTTATRATGKVYTITEVKGKFISHVGEGGTVAEGHVDQYQLVDLGEVKKDAVKEAIKTAAPEILTVPAAKDPEVLADWHQTKQDVKSEKSDKPEVDFKKALKETQDLSAKIMALSLEQGQKLARDMINTVQSQLDEVKRQSCQILKVQINDQTIKDLKTQAVPYLKRMLISAKLGKNIMLVGPAGCGKTTAAEQLATALGVPFHNLTFTAGASETWLFGRQTPNGFVPGSFWLAYKDGGVFLADEFDAGDANLILSINTAIENGHCFNPISGESVKRNSNFVMIAACNTFGKGGDGTYTGRNRLDAASLRRFAGSVIAVDYNEDIEKVLCPDNKLRTALTEARYELRKIGSTEILSTGCIKNAYDLVSNGVPFKEISESLALSWPDDLKSIMTKAVKFYSGQSKSKSNPNEIPF